MNTAAIRTFFKNKTVLVTGGTGSFGEYLVRELLTLPVKKIIIFSRDEWKQHVLKYELEAHAEKLLFVIGDVRNMHTLLMATRGVDVIYHAAAMKHVPIAEENPMEAVYTNVVGAYNLREVAIRNSIPRVVVISTDKAIKSVNVMGMTKAIQERIILANHSLSSTRFMCVRFGNVVGSRGSVIPLFYDQLKKGKPLTVTDKAMTRYLITLKEAMELIMTATLKGKGREIYIKKMPVCRVTDIADVMIEAFGKPVSYPVKYVGIREGEQLYESLVSEEEMRRATETDEYYIIYPYGTPGLPKPKKQIEEYRTDRQKEVMSKATICSILKKTGWVS